MTPHISILISEQSHTEYALYGFKSWILQKCDFDYEIILILFNKNKNLYNNILKHKPKNCSVIIKEYPNLEYNISLGNNIAYLYSNSNILISTNSDIIYIDNFLNTICNRFKYNNYNYLTSSNRCNICLKDIKRNNNFNYLSGVEKYKKTIPGISSTIYTKELFNNIGGYDNNITCHEDTDFCGRVALYNIAHLGSYNLDLVESNKDLYGYHIHHPKSNIFNNSKKCIEIIQSRTNYHVDGIDETKQLLGDLL